MGFRLATGAADPVSTNQTLGDSFDKKPVWIDQAYFDWHPGTIKGFDFVGGKMPIPFYRVGNNQLIWDDDLNPEGLAARYELPLSDTLKAYINGGGFWVGHPDTASAADTSLWGIQGYLKNTFEDKSYLLGGMSYYNYGNIEDQNDLAKVWKGSSSFFGNTSTSGDYKYDFDIVEGFAEYGFKLADFPVVVFGSYAYNTAAPSSIGNGWLIGTTFNKTKDPGSWQIGYDYRDLDSDAVVGQFNDSDFVGGGTNGKGHRFSFTYQLAKNFQAGLTYFLDEKKDSYENDYRRLQADLVFKF
ncbi:MAG: putative porin [Sedimentisphaerales bacterium]|nr:putative porin [Sedimentisphaerales bacterium]